MGKFLAEYQEALHKAKHEGRQIRSGAVLTDLQGRYLILGRFRKLGSHLDTSKKEEVTAIARTHELPSGKVYGHQSLETAVLANVHRETGLALSNNDILAYLNHFDYQLILGGRTPKTQFNFLVYAGKDPQLHTPRSFSWAYPDEIGANFEMNSPDGFYLSQETRETLKLPKIADVLRTSGLVNQLAKAH